jgi:DNA-binding beta-propeller fold protein YncE
MNSVDLLHGFWKLLFPPLIVSAASSLYYDFIAMFKQIFGLENLNLMAVSFFSTIPERLLLFFLCSIILLASFFYARFLRSSLLRYLFPIFAVFILFLGLYLVFPLNKWIFPGNHPVAISLFLALVVAILRLPRWLRSPHSDINSADRPIISWLPSVILVPALAMLLLNGFSLRGLAAKIHEDKDVQQFVSGDFKQYLFGDLNNSHVFGDLSGLALDTERGLLYASGHGTNYLLAYNINALDQPPHKSQVEVGFAQGFEYNPRDQELYIYNEQAHTLLFLDSTTLALKKTVLLPNVAPGDVGIRWDKHTDQLFIVSEWDEDEDDDSLNPFIAFDRMTGKILYTMQLNPWNILMHPSKPILYMRFFYDRKVVAYDTKARRIVRSIQVPKDHALQGMAMTPDQSELLVASTVHSKVLRFDADTLEWKGSIDAVFGVRSLAVDPARNLLFCGSMVNDMLEVIDLGTYKRIAQYHLGPWLRVIRLDTKAGIAYISSLGGLFRVDYNAAIQTVNQTRRGNAWGNEERPTLRLSEEIRNPLKTHKIIIFPPILDQLDEGIFDGLSLPPFLDTSWVKLPANFSRADPRRRRLSKQPFTLPIKCTKETQTRKEGVRDGESPVGRKSQQ